ncbi:MAG: plasmid partition protein ParG [Candidatus Ozemobacteraceae bacterium]
MNDNTEKKKLTLNLPAEKHKRLKIAGVEDGRSITEIIETLVDEYLDSRKHGLSAKEESKK